MARGIPKASVLSEKVARAIKANIGGYGAHLVSLPEETWNTSACQWMGTYWDLLVDLFAKEAARNGQVLCRDCNIKKIDK